MLLLRIVAFVRTASMKLASNVKQMKFLMVMDAAQFHGVPVTMPIILTVSISG